MAKLNKEKSSGLNKEKKELLKKYAGKSSSKIDWTAVRDEYMK